MTWLFWALFVVAVLHVAEEYTTGFLSWFRSAIPRLAPGMTPLWAVTINSLFLGFALLTAILETLPVWMRLALPALLAINAILHIAMTVRMRRWSPGLATASVLLLPISMLAFLAAANKGYLTTFTVLGSAVGGLALHAVPLLSLLGLVALRREV